MSRDQGSRSPAQGFKVPVFWGPLEFDSLIVRECLSILTEFGACLTHEFCKGVFFISFSFFFVFSFLGGHDYCRSNHGHIAEEFSQLCSLFSLKSSPGEDEGSIGDNGSNQLVHAKRLIDFMRLRQLQNSLVCRHAVVVCA